MIVTLPACNKSQKSNTASGNAPAAVHCESQKINSLFAFVPEDSPIVFSSTREIDLNHPFFQRLRSQSEKYIAASEKFFERSTDPAYTRESLEERLEYASPYERQEILTNYLFFSPDEESKKEFEKNIEFLKRLEVLAKDFKTHAPEFGLNPEHIDQILYLDDTALVFKQTVEDGAKLKSQLDTFFQNIPLQVQIQYKEIKAEDETWSILSMVPENQIKLEMLKRKRAEFVKNSDPKAVETYNRIIDGKEEVKDPDAFFNTMLIATQTQFVPHVDDEIKGLEKIIELTGNDNPSQNRSSIAIHFGQNIVTVLLLVDEKQLATYNRVLKPAAKPLNDPTFCPSQPNTIAFGYLDNVKGLNKLLKSDLRNRFEDLLGLDHEIACDEELASIIADYPKLQFNARVEGNNQLITNSVLSFKDKEAIKSLEDLHVKSLDLISDKTKLGLQLNMNLSKLFNQILAKADTISKKEYKCSILSQIASISKELPVVVKDPDFAPTQKLLDSITGINAAFDKFQINPREKFLDFEGVINASGPDFAAVASDVIPIIQSFDRSIAREIQNNEALVVGADPKEVHLGEWTLNAMLTQTDFIAATPQYDVKSILSKERTDNHKFFSLKLSDQIIFDGFVLNIVNEHYRYDDSPTSANFIRFLKEIREINKDIVYTLSLGTTAEGIAGTSSTVF